MATQLEIADNPSHIWNCDETGLQSIFIPNTVVAEKGLASYQITCGEKSATTTVLAGLSKRVMTMIHRSKSRHYDPICSVLTGKCTVSYAQSHAAVIRVRGALRHWK